MLDRDKDIKETICHICKKKKYCIEDFFYDEEYGWNKVFVCLKCYKEN